MNMLKKTTRPLHRPFFLIASLFSLLFIISCEKEPLSGLQVDPETSVRNVDQRSIIKDSELQLIQESVLDKVALSTLETEFAAYRTQLSTLKKEYPRAKSNGTIFVPDPEAGIFTIQDGVDAAEEGNMIKVRSGVYEEQVIISTPGIKVTAEGKVRLYGGFMVDSDDVAIRKFEIYPISPAGVYGNNVSRMEVSGNSFRDAASVSVIISSGTDCKVKDNDISGGDVGIFLTDSFNDGPSTGNIINNNRVTGGRSSGILVDNNSTGNTIKSNTFIETATVSGGGIYLVDAQQNMIKDNKSSGNRNGLVLVTGSSENTIKNNSIEMNSNYGIYVGTGSNKNQVIDNISNSNTYGIGIRQAGSGNRFSENSCNENRIGILLSESSEQVIGPKNISSKNTQAGIWLQNYSNNNLITDNTVHSNDGSGIAVLYISDFNQVTGNSCQFNRDGINLTSAWSNKIGPGNKANQNRDFGIALKAYTSYNEVTGNSALDNGYCDLLNFWDDTNSFSDNEYNCFEDL